MIEKKYKLRRPLVVVIFLPPKFVFLVVVFAPVDEYNIETINN